jgi:hypothetical protein
MKRASSVTFSNWNGSATSTPSVAVRPRDLEELIEVVKDEGRYPAPVRAVGNLHSLVPCFVTTGTHVDMSNFNGVSVDPDSNSITVGANVKLIQIRDALRSHGLQTEVTPEIGSATAGSVACCGTKDASIGRQGLAQVSSTVISARLVNASGEVETISEDANPDKLHAFRSSYGLLGIVFEVTFRTQPAVILDYDYEVLGLSPVPSLSEVRGGADGVLGFLLPYSRMIIVERRYLADGDRRISRFSRAKRRSRDLLWEKVASFFPTFLPHDRTYDLMDQGLALSLRTMHLLGGFRAHRADSTIDFKSNRSHVFDFTFCAVPQSRWIDFVPAYLALCSEFRARTGYRVSMLSEVYLMNEDNHSLLSPTRGEDAFTMDVTDHRPNHPLWIEFNKRFNSLVADFGGRPLLNQTKQLDRDIVHRTLGEDWKRFLAQREAEDPNGRFVSDYFKDLM